MALVVADRVQETTTTTGTGTYTLAGAKDGFQSFAAIGNSNTTYYACTDGTDYEVGIGTFTLSGTTLARTTIIESSNSDAAVNWGAGSKDIFVTSPADKTLLVGRNLYADNPSNPTAPNASASNSVAIGKSSVSGGGSSIAIGASASSGGNLSSALGFNATVGSSGSYSAAIGQAYSNGSDAFAAAIASNSSSYGATGANSVAMGQQAKATGIGSVALGYGGPLASGTVSFAAQRGQATGNGSIAMGHFNSYGLPTASGLGAIVIGDGSTGSATRSVVLGNDNTSSHNDAVVIGSGASSSAADEITLGHTDQTVRISSSYTLPTSDGTNGQVLTTDGAGAVTFADAAGADLYTANPSSATDPSATGANAIAIGSNAGSTGTNGIAIGTGADVLNSRSDAIAIGTNAGANGNDSIAIGEDAATSSGTTAAIAIGRASDARGPYSIAIGYTADAGTSSTRSTSIGYLAKSSGDDAVALGYSYVDEAGGFAAVIGNNTSTYGAQGANGVAIGLQAKTLGAQGLALGAYSQAAQTEAVALGGGYAQGVKSISIGSSSHATSTYGCAVGYDTTAVGSALALGTQANAQQGYSVAIHRGKSEVQGKIAFSGIFFSAIGDAQGGSFVLVADTTDATATVLTGNNGTASSTNQIVAASDTCIMFSGTIVAMQNGAQDQGGWEIKGLLKNDGGTTTLVSSNIQTFADGNGWTVALSADNTNNALAITCTGEAAHNIRWVANISTSEVTYA